MTGFSALTRPSRGAWWAALAALLLLSVTLWSVSRTGGFDANGSGNGGSATPPEGNEGDTDASRAPSSSAPDDPTSVPGNPAPLPAGNPVSCPPATVTVHTAQELADALAQAVPGASIRLSDGVYSGSFVATASGTPDKPIWLCGGPQAVLDGQGITRGYGLHLAPAQYWRVVGFTVRNAQKGVVADGTRGTVIQDLTVANIGDEGIHLRAFSTGNAVLDNTVRRTGLRRDKFGEGIYIGSAESNWATYSAGGPDRSDNNLVQGNTISETTAESVDIKEGTTGGALIGNTFDGSGTTAADSWVDVKGNDWLIADNTGAHTSEDGYQTHRILDGWGVGNLFQRNVARTRGSGVDIYIHKPDDTDNQVLCDNEDAAGNRATSNSPCRPLTDRS